MRTLCVAMILALAACKTGPVSDDGPSEEQKQAWAEENEKLKEMHDGIWAMMGLSEKAVDELNGIVLHVNKALQENKHHNPAHMEEHSEVVRTHKPSHEEYMANHKKRFDALGISDETQAELFKAAEFVWKALHDPDVPEEQKKIAMKIKEMMSSGPPPCCDDNIFKRVEKP